MHEIKASSKNFILHYNFNDISLHFISDFGYLTLLNRLIQRMNIDFSKYQGTGNDFLMIDNREQIILPDKELILKLCHRRFGIGADGLILLENATNYDFRMRYFNSDGSESGMCGNGGRCIVAFAKDLGIVEKKAFFVASDGEHEAFIEHSKSGQLKINLKMSDVSEIEVLKDAFFMNTGSPHYVKFIDSHTDFNTCLKGREIRYGKRFAKEGTNVNFVSFPKGEIFVSTYERGVEEETYSCGTGAVAVAISLGLQHHKENFKLTTKGGQLEVRFRNPGNQSFFDIWLIGSAKKVFSGIIEI